MFMEIAQVVSKRSTCSRKKVGCILVVDGRIISTGYNGVLPNVNHDEGLDEDGNSKTVHAETNAIAFCAKYGIPTQGAQLWVTLSPCDKCAEIIIQAGIKEVVYLDLYRDQGGLDKLINNNVKVYKYNAKYLQNNN